MNTKHLLFLAVAFAAAPLRAAEPWPASRSVVPSDALCRSNPVMACMDMALRYMDGEAQGVLQKTPVFVVRRVIAHDPVEERYSYADAVRNLRAQARALRLPADIPLNDEAKQRMATTYSASLAHLAIMRAPQGPQKTAAMRHVAIRGGTPESFIAGAQLLR